MICCLLALLAVLPGLGRLKPSAGCHDTVRVPVAIMLFLGAASLAMGVCHLSGALAGRPLGAICHAF
jgi:hypothetical protein